MSDEHTILQMAAFEKVMIDGGYFKPQRSRWNPDTYLYERDQDRFNGWMLLEKMKVKVTEKTFLYRVLDILKGMDIEQSETDYGWWETNSGAEFGRAKLNELIKLISEHEGEQL